MLNLPIMSLIIEGHETFRLRYDQCKKNECKFDEGKEVLLKIELSIDFEMSENFQLGNIYDNNASVSQWTDCFNEKSISENRRSVVIIHGYIFVYYEWTMNSVGHSFLTTTNFISIIVVLVWYHHHCNNYLSQLNFYCCLPPQVHSWKKSCHNFCSVQPTTLSDVPYLSCISC